MDSFGYHALCLRGKLQKMRHDEVVYALNSLDFEAQLRPYPNAPVQCLGISWQSSSDGTTAFCPADVLLDWDHLPRRTCVDVTIVSPILAHMPATFHPSKAAPIAEDSKYSKYWLACIMASWVCGRLFWLFGPRYCPNADSSRSYAGINEVVPTITSF